MPDCRLGGCRLATSAAFLAFVSFAVPSLAQSCAGDCDDDRSVSVSELVRGTRIALAQQPVDDCSAFDADASGAVTIDEVVGGVHNSLETCPVDLDASLFGHWSKRDDLPAFLYDADQDTLPEAEWDPIVAPLTRRHWVMLGNRALQMQVANDGTVALFDESEGLRWLTAPDPKGTGVSIVRETDGTEWGTDYEMRGGETIPRREFGPTWLDVRDELRGLSLERTIYCPEGEVAWVLVRVRLTLSSSAKAERSVRHVEQWALRPRFLNFLEGRDARRARAQLAVTYHVRDADGGLLAQELFASPNDPGAAGAAARFLIGSPATLMLQPVGDTTGVSSFAGTPHPVLEIQTDLTLQPGETRELWFRFGRAATEAVTDPGALVASNLELLRARLPQAAMHGAPEAELEIPWNAALLTGGASTDAVLGAHTLDQGSTYPYEMGFNGAARDPLQHALPLVYSEPDLALSVLRNTASWGSPDGDLPYALDGAKQPITALFRPSDTNLWSLWLATEFAAATGDLAAFNELVSYHPSYRAPAVPLREHLRRQFRFFVDFVGRGERNHVRILNADWNDLAIAESGVDRDLMIEHGSSVLNSAMASWVLRRYAGLAARLGDKDLEAEARAIADELRDLVAEAWNGRWFHRAYAPGVPPVGDEDCWLEVQPWAILAGAATPEQARSLLQLIDEGHRAGSPLGARIRWPANPERVEQGTWGEGTSGGIWYSINMTLVWAAAKVDPALALDEWRKMTLAAHTSAYPAIWEGTLSGPDSWNAVESPRPGHTWGAPGLFAMQAFPVNNLHSHAQPLLAYLRLLGIEPTERGSLAVGGGGSFSSRTFRLDADGHGRLDAVGPVVVETGQGEVRGGPGSVEW